MLPAGATIRLMNPADVPAVLRLRKALWPACPDEDNAEEVGAYARGECPEPLGGALWVCALPSGRLAGFAEASLRSYAEGCHAASPVGYIEGWLVEEDLRGQGIGRALIEACEAWARSRGCVEMGSDAELENAASHKAHAALGYEEVERVVCFRKRLV